MNEISASHVAVFEQHRRLLFSIAYRMLGSAAEAEDVLQDAYLRFQSTPLAAIGAPKAYLCTIVTRLCLNELTSARARREVYLGTWLPEPVTSAGHPEFISPEAYASQYDSISIAFLTLLERLTPAERAVLLLHEVFDYEYDEIAGMLGKSAVACRKLLSRAKGYISANHSRFKTDPQEHRRLLEAFIGASASGDLQGLTALLSDDVTFWADGGGKVRGAALQPIHGREDVAQFVIAVTRRYTPAGAQTAITDVNGRPALILRQAGGAPALVVSIEVDEEHIHAIWAIANPDKLGAV